MKLKDAWQAPDLVVFAAFLWPHRGGLEQYVWEICRRMPNYKVTIFTCNTENAATIERIDQITIVRLPCWNFLGKTYPIPKPILFTFQLLNGVDWSKVIAINGHTRFFSTSLLALALAKIHRRPYLHTEHGAGFVVHPNPFIQSVAWLYDQTLGRLVLNQAAMTTTVSQAATEFIQDLGARQSNALISNGVDPVFFYRRKTELRQKLNIPPKATVITYIGRLIASKGAEILIAAFLKTANPSNHLIIVGDGPLYTKLQQSLNTEDQIHLVGSQSRDQVVKFLSITDIFVLPSITTEGLPTSVLEAGAVGCAVIASGRGGTREIIDKSTGILLPEVSIDSVAQAIDQLIKSPRERLRLSQNLQAKVLREYNWSQLVPKFQKVIQQIAHLQQT